MKQPNQPVQRMTRQIAKGGVIALVGQLGAKVIHLLLQILLTRVLGAGGYGLYTLGLSTMQTVQTFSLCGLQNGVTRFGAAFRAEGDTRRLNETINVALTISFLVSAATGILLFFLSDSIAAAVFAKLDLALPLRLFAVSLPFYAFVVVVSHTVRVFRRMEFDVVLRQVFHPLATLLLAGLGFLLGFRLMGVVFAFLISSVVAFGIGLYLLTRAFPGFRFRLAFSAGPPGLLPYSLTVLLSGVLYLLVGRADRIMLGIFRPAEAVGVYGASAAMAVQATIFLTAFSAIFSPVMAELFRRGSAVELGKLLKATTRWIVTLTLPVVLVLTIFARPIMGLFGLGFREDYLVLIVLAVSYSVNAATGLVGVVLIMSGRERLELLNNLALGGLNVALNLLMIPKYGVLGAAVATGASIVLVNLTKLIEVYALYRVHSYTLSYWKPVVAAGCSVGVWKMLSCTGCLEGRRWLIGVVAVGVTYLAVLAMVGLDAEDKEILAASWARLRRSPSRRK